MQPVDTCIKCCSFAFLTNGDFHFFLGFFHHFFNTGRMHTPVHNEFFQCDSGNLSADRVETGKNNRFWCIVNDQVNACQCFQRADVSAFTTDDTAFHFIIRQLYHRYCGFCHMIHSTSLDGIGNDFSGAFVRFHFCLAFDFLDHQCRFMLHICFHHSQNVILCFFGGQTGNTFQLLQLFFTQFFRFFFLSFQILQFSGHLFFLAFQRLCLSV